MDSEGKKRGLIRYVLLVVCHPEWQPTAAQMSEFLLNKFPGFASQPNGSAKVGLLYEAKPMHLIDMNTVAMESFGKEVSDNSKYTYRTMHFSLKGGEAKILVIYDNAISGPRKWYRFWE